MKHSILHEKLIKAESYEKNNQLLEAINIYKEIYRLEPSNRDFVFKLGSLYSQIDDFDNAEMWFILATDLVRDYVSFFNLGSLYYRYQHYKKAIITLERAKVYNEYYSQIKVLIGLSYSRLDNLKAAEANFNSVIKDEPNNRIALTALAILYYNSNRNDKALSTIELICSNIDSNENCNELMKLKKNLTLRILGENRPSLRNKADGYKIYDEFIKSIPLKNYTDKYGTLNEKIEKLTTIEKPTKKESIALSLCYLFRGDSDEAMNELLKIKKNIN